MLRRSNSTRYLGEQLDDRLYHARRDDLRDAAGRQYWEISVADLEIPAHKWQHVQPDGAEALLVSIDVMYSEWYFTQDGDSGDHLGAIRTADLHVVVSGRLIVGGHEIALADHWRVEAHQHEDADESSSAHPRFHVQRGGWKASEFQRAGGFIAGWPYRRQGDHSDIATGSRGFMICPSPRIAQPPMDPVVAIDFAISQYHGPAWRELWDAAEYADLVGRRQNALWGAFFGRLASLAHGGDNSFWPQYWGPRRPAR